MIHDLYAFKKMNSHSIQLRQLLSQDIPFGMQLSTLAGWNQTPTDWEFLLKHHPNGNFLATYLGEPAGTITTKLYDHHFSWIGMVLVHPDYRRKGIGKAMMKAVIDYAYAYGAIRLDATDMGRPLYLQLGFEDELTWKRWTRIPIRQSFQIHQDIVPIIPELYPAIFEMDHVAFGTDRKDLLMHLIKYYPDLGYVMIKGETVMGYCLGRKGRLYHQIGPLVARDLPTAKSLLEYWVYHWQDYPVVIDTLEINSDWADHLQGMGLEEKRILYRMNLGNLEDPGQKDLQFALAGPEYG